VSWEDPAALAAAGSELPGIDFLRGILDRALPPAPIQALLGMDLVEVDDGRVVFALQPGEHHYNPIGVVHGGIAGTMLDSAMGAAVHSTLPLGSGYSTLETTFNLVAPISATSGEIFCEGQVLHRGSRVATAEGRVTAAADGRLLAHGTSTCLVTKH
jgi:uncharacterized protein (TIGR00369 family)